MSRCLILLVACLLFHLLDTSSDPILLQIIIGTRQFSKFEMFKSIDINIIGLFYLLTSESHQDNFLDIESLNSKRLFKVFVAPRIKMACSGIG